MTKQQINLKDLDKTKWQTYRFDEIAKSITERIDPNNTDLEIYIGLEHLDPESIHIKRNGSKNDVKGQKLKCYPGDVIFGKRRAYQRKAAVVTKEGFCSAHSMVLRANPDVIEPKLFPFFLHSDLFMHRAIDISVGSLSPTINWGTLKSQKYILPLKDQQAQLAELLWAMDEVIEKELIVMERIEYQTTVYLNKAFRYGAFLNKQSVKTAYGEIPSNWSLKKLNELGEFKNGINKNKKQFGYGKPFVNLMDVFGHNELYNKDFDLVDVSENEIQSFNVKKGDVLFVRSSVKPSGVGLTTLVQEDINNTVFSGFIIRFRPATDILTHLYKKYCFYEERFRYSLCRRSTISANTNINQESLKKILIPIPPMEEQYEFNEKMSKFDKIRSLIEYKINASKSLQKSLINQVF